MSAKKPNRPYATTMNVTTSSAATIPAVTPALMESAPRLGPTERSSATSSVAGNAPARSSTARSLADAGVKLPVIWPDPPVIGCWIVGAVIT